MNRAADTRKVVARLVLGTVLMFGFGFAMVPIYDVFCQITGLNGKISRTGEVNEPIEVVHSRQVKVRFISSFNENMPWEFGPKQAVYRVNPGQMQQTAFFARNPTSKNMVAQAIPSVSPAEAAQYLHKVNCFCFDRQPLDAGAEAEMPMVFFIDPKIPEHLDSITLSYTLFDITDQVEVADTQTVLNEKRSTL